MLSGFHTDSIFDATYVDDDAMVFSSPDASQLLPRLRRATAIVASVYTRFQLTLNFSAGKTEALVCFRRTSAKQLLVEMAMQLKNVVVIETSSEPISLRVVHRYTYLGSVCVASGAMAMEIRPGPSSS